MIDQERDSLFLIKQAEVLYNRLPENHIKRSRIDKFIRIKKAGYRGEKNLLYHLSILNKERYTILNGIRLEQNEQAFQIDTLLLSTNYALIIEAKNYSGSLHIDPFTNQLIQNNANKEKSYPNPVIQVKRHQLLFGKWLESHKYPTLPIEYLVAFQEGNSIFKTEKMNKQIFNRIIYSENIHDRINKFEQVYRVNVLDEKRVRKLKRQILHQHTPKKINIFQQFNIHPSELFSGVECPACHSFGMRKIYAGWKCPYCLCKSKDAHEKAIGDFLLLNNSITNQQCKQYLHLSSSKSAFRLLKSLNLSYSGNNKDRIYYKDKHTHIRKEASQTSL
jgi:hypothetical protein